MPFLDHFVLKPQKLPPEEEQIRLLWWQKDSDYSFRQANYQRVLFALFMN